MGGASFTNDENTVMIEHEVGLHHLATQVKQVFDETLTERGIHGAPGIHNQMTALVKKLELNDSQIFTLLPMLSMESLTALSLKTRMRSYSISLWHTPFSRLDPMGVNFRSTQGVIHWGSNQVLGTSSAS